MDELEDELGKLDELKLELDELLEGELGQLDELKNVLGKLGALMDELDELLSWKVSWVSWMS